jgi:hypothetical protein
MAIDLIRLDNLCAILKEANRKANIFFGYP